MPAQARDQLKKYFRNGNLAREEYFIDLIDSSVNKVSDQFAVSDESGVNIIASSVGKKFFSLFRSKVDAQQQKASFSIQYREDQSNGEGLSFDIAAGNAATRSLLFLKRENMATGIAGKIGVNTVRPQAELDVNGAVAMRTRVGSFRDTTIDYATVVADGKWHKVLSGLKGLNAFEVIAAVGDKTRVYAMHYSIAMNVQGREGAVKPMERIYSAWWYRLRLRWARENNGTYALEVCTGRRYRNAPQIQIRMTRLWN